MFANWGHLSSIQQADDSQLTVKAAMNVASVEELKSAVSHLSVENLSRFSEWFEEFMADQWDQKIEADILAGRLSAAGKRADDDFEAGRVTPL